MNNKYLLFVCLLLNFNSFAQSPFVDTFKTGGKHHIERFYVGTAFDAGIFSTATIQEKNATVTNKLGTVRFSYVINYGFTFNFNLSRHFGIYTGIDIKNIGFIENNNAGETVKRRTYNLGAPLGFKLGNLRRLGSNLFLGGGLDVPINYKEKEFVIRDQKTKFNEWFSDRTPAVMPYIFAGTKIKSGFTFKLQYYPGNFLNPDFTANGIKPYNGYVVHLILFSIGYDLHLSKRKDIVKANAVNIRTNTL